MYYLRISNRAEIKKCTEVIFVYGGFGYAENKINLPIYCINFDRARPNKLIAMFYLNYFETY